MSASFARLRGALDRVGTTTPGTIVGVFAEDLTAIMNHYVEVVREAAELKARAQPAQAVPSDVVRDAERYRWLRDKGFAYADVDLGSDFDEDTFVSYRIKFNVPEPAHYKFEDDEWTAADIDAAIDAAIAQQKGGV